MRANLNLSPCSQSCQSFSSRNAQLAKFNYLSGDMTWSVDPKCLRNRFHLGFPWTSFTPHYQCATYSLWVILFFCRTSNGTKGTPGRALPRSDHVMWEITAQVDCVLFFLTMRSQLKCKIHTTANLHGVKEDSKKKRASGRRKLVHAPSR